jgi:hypothetical protein
MIYLSGKNAFVTRARTAIEDTVVRQFIGLGTMVGVAGRRTAIPERTWENCFFIRDLASHFGGVRDAGIGCVGVGWRCDFYSGVKTVSVFKGLFGQIGG